MSLLKACALIAVWAVCVVVLVGALVLAAVR